MKKFLKKHVYDVVLISVILASVALTALLYRTSVIRAAQAVRDLGISIAFYFCGFFDHEIPVTVTQYPDIDILKYLPYDFDELLRRLKEMWKVIFRKDCFLGYLSDIAVFLNDFSMYLMLLVPVFVLLGYLIKRKCLEENGKAHGKKSKALAGFETRILPKLLRVGHWGVGLLNTFRQTRYYFYPLVLLWLVNMNVVTILLEALAFYFYFAMAFDFLSFIPILLKALLDVAIMLLSAPVVFWFVAAYSTIVFFRKRIGYKRLDACEAKNRIFIEKQPVVMMLTGTMGTGKTTTLTDIGISAEIMFRNKAYELILELDSKYPNFPWIALEDEIRKMIRYRQIYNLTSCRDWCDKKAYRYLLRDPGENKIFGYEDEYRVALDDGLTDLNIWETIRDYACLYFIYIIESSLLVSNYSVRVDSVLDYAGNFPLWNTELFRNSPALSEAQTRHAHIIDYDVLRLGMQVLEDNPNRGSFEFGVVLLSEIGKERGNTLTLQEVKKGEEKANQKNDLFGYAVKMCRHKATVANFPFIRIVTDEQRPESLGADMRDLLNIVHIRSKDEKRLLIPWFFLTEIVHDFVYPRFRSFYTQYRYRRGDRDLMMYLLHNAVSSLHNYVTKQYNIFGMNLLHVEVERGTQDEEKREIRYYLCSKKVYSNRFSTDCYRAYFETQLRQTKIGLDDYKEYLDTVATADEMHYQNSYFIADMEKIQK